MTYFVLIFSFYSRMGKKGLCIRPTTRGSTDMLGGSQTDRDEKRS